MDELEKQFSGKLIEKAVVLEKTEDFWTVHSNSLRECNEQGIWILYGKAEKVTAQLQMLWKLDK